MGGHGKNRKGKRRTAPKKRSNSPEPPKEADIVSSSENPSSSKNRRKKRYCNEEELENLIVNRLTETYGEAISTLTSNGYKHDAVMNALFAIERKNNIKDSDVQKVGQKGAELISFVDEAVRGMITNLREARPGLNKGGVLWCLLVSNFNLAVAKTLKVPKMTKDRRYPILEESEDEQEEEEEQEEKEEEEEEEEEEEPVEEYIQGRSQEVTLMRNVATFAAVCRANIHETSEETQALIEKHSEPYESLELSDFEDSRLVNLTTSGYFRKGGNTEIMYRFCYDIKRFKDNVQERTDWAVEKVTEAAKRLGNELLELKTLRLKNRGKTPKDENNYIREEFRMKSLMDWRNETTEVLARPNRHFAKICELLGSENEDMKAEIEAFKLRSSESEEKLGKVLKEENRILKKILVLEKQFKKIENDIREIGESSMVVKQELVEINKARDDIKAMLRQEVEAKEQATNKVQEEQKVKGQTKAEIRKSQRELRQEIEKNRQKHEDYISFLERKVAFLEEPSGKGDNDVDNLPDFLFSWESQSSEAQGEEFKTEIRDREYVNDEISSDRACVFCSEREISVVLLPCAHQVLCSECAKILDHGKSEARCPCCESFVEEKIHVYGGRS